MMHMEALPNDLILEIISRLPLKYVVQCKCLNKNFNLLISDPTFQYQHALRSKTSFDFLLHYSPYPTGLSMWRVDSQISRGNRSSIDATRNGPEELRLHGFSTFPLILSSSGGLLLLEFRRDNSNPLLCVVNPVTGAYRFIRSPPRKRGAKFIIALVSQFTINHPASSYKLVAACSTSKKLVVFKIFDSDASNWRTPGTTCSSNGIPLAGHHQTACLDDSLYWLKQDTEILEFNVKTEIAKIIKSPADLWPSFGTIFGVSTDQGKLAIATNVKYKTKKSKKISIYIYDSALGEWKVDKILKDTYPNSNKGSRGYPVFYDGKRLYQLIVHGIDCENELYMYDVSALSSTKVKKMAWWSDITQEFKPFSGTLARIPSCRYLQGTETLSRISRCRYLKGRSFNKRKPLKEIFQILHCLKYLCSYY